MSDVWLTIGLFDPCDETEEPVATFETLHAEHDRERITWLLTEYRKWAEGEPDVYLVLAAFQVEASQHGQSPSS